MSSELYTEVAESLHSNLDRLTDKMPAETMPANQRLATPIKSLEDLRLFRQTFVATRFMSSDLQKMRNAVVTFCDFILGQAMGFDPTPEPAVVKTTPSFQELIASRRTGAAAASVPTTTTLEDPIPDLSLDTFDADELDNGYTRPELNLKAQLLGVTGAEELPNKTSVIEVIKTALEAAA